MTFADLVAGDLVFVDTNVLVYRFSLHPQFGTPCRDLLDRIERLDLTGYTSAAVVGEAAHRLMTLEAINHFAWPQRGIGNRLRTDPGKVTQLKQFRSAIEQVLQSKLQVLTVGPGVLAAGVALCQQIGLLVNDALAIAAMRAHGLTRVASADTDLDRVPGISRYAPA